VSALRGKGDAYARSAMRIDMTIASITALLQMATGDISAREVADTQPAKLAAMEAHFETRADAPILIGGIVDQEARTIRGAIVIPDGLSLLAAHDPHATIAGLDRVPEDEQPRVGLVHAAFDVMVGAGSALAVLGAWYWLFVWRKKGSRLLLRALAVGSPLGFVALEAGWIVAEAGRQPWVVHGVLRTRDAVTPAAHVPVTLCMFGVIYMLLGIVLVVALRRIGSGAYAHPADEAHAA